MLELKMKMKKIAILCLEETCFKRLRRSKKPRLVIQLIQD